MDIVILDLEWNGSFSRKIHKYVNEIIEFGAVKVDENLKIIDTFKALVHPEIGRKLSSHIASLTHISNDRLFSEGKPFLEVAEQFGNFSKGCVILTWGTSDILTMMDNFSYYNGDGKISFLEKYCNLQEYCEYRLGLHDPASQLGLQTCADKLGITLDENELHRAYTDAVLSLKCLEATYDADEFPKYVCDADEEFYRRVTFKNKTITDINNPLVDRKKFFFVCDDCGVRAEQLTHFKVKNKNFAARFRCPKCRKIFEGRITVRLRFDGVSLKKRIVINKPKDLED